MRIGGGRESWMVLLPVAALAVLVTVYLGGPDRTLYFLERLVYGIWDQAVLFFRR